MQDPETALTLPDPLPLDSGAVLSPVTIAYQEYGKRAADGS
ncbi:MAG: homoserine O-acetyltransferase, partial [Alteriqipengyuania sp.]